MTNSNTGQLLTTPDVPVIGAGAAGVAAAAGAAQHGASVVIIEKNAFGGGKATAAYVGTVCGLYYRSGIAVPRFVHQGFPMEFALELGARSHAEPVRHKSGLHFLPYDHFQFELLCDEWMRKSAAAVCFNSHLSGAVQQSNTITSVNVIIGNRLVEFKPATVVDASGEDLLAGLLGISSIQSDQYQAAAQVFQLSGISETNEDRLSLAALRTIQKGIGAGRLNSQFDRVSVVPGSLRNGSVLLKLPLPVPIKNNILYHTQIQLHSRNAVNELANYLNLHGDTFKNCRLSFVAPEAGVGPGHAMRENMSFGPGVLAAAKHDDSVARGAWPVEYWETGKRVQMEYFDMDDYYDIPAGALQSAAVSNLFFGGRNISADDKAIASARVIGTCLATGYASGSLAAYRALKKPVAAAIFSVQKHLFPAQVKA